MENHFLPKFTNIRINWKSFKHSSITNQKWTFNENIVVEKMLNQNIVKGPEVDCNHSAYIEPRIFFLLESSQILSRF